MSRYSSFHWLFACFVVLGSIGTCGCSWIKSLKATEDSASFPAWSQKLSGGVRGPEKGSEAKPSGLLFDKRSQEIEKNLGGGF